MQVRISQAKSMLTKYIKVGLVPMLHGSPGMGKSSIVHQVAQEYNLKVIDLRLSQEDPTSLLGFPMIKGNKAGYVPMDHFPIEGDEIPKGYSGWLLFLDEINGAPLAVQKASYKLILDRMVGIHHLHKNLAIVGAGNLDTDNAAVESMSTALQSRLAHIELMSDVDEWLLWASNKKVDHRITSYIKFKPGNLYAFSPDHSDKTFACNRTWEFANRVLSVTEEDDADRLPMLTGVISEGVAREFIGFCKIYQNLPTMDQIKASPEGITVPSEPSILFALTGSLAHNMNQENCAELMKFIIRLPVEFQVITLREVKRRKQELLSNPAVQKWVTTSATNLF